MSKLKKIISIAIGLISIGLIAFLCLKFGMKVINSWTVDEISGIIGAVLGIAGLVYSIESNRENRFNKSIEDLDDAIKSVRINSENTDTSHNDKLFAMTKDVVTVQSQIQHHISTHDAVNREFLDIRERINRLEEDILKFKYDIQTEIARNKSDNRWGNIVFRLNKLEQQQQPQQD